MSALSMDHSCSKEDMTDGGFGVESLHGHWPEFCFGEEVEFTKGAFEHELEEVTIFWGEREGNERRGGIRDTLDNT